MDGDSDNDLVAASQEAELKMKWRTKKTLNKVLGLLEPVSDIDLAEMAKTSQTKNTLKRNKWAVNTSNSWAIARNNRQCAGNLKEKVKALEVINNRELGNWLSKFVCEVRKTDGSDYPPKSIISLCMGIQGHLRMQRKVSLDILRNPDFELFRQVLGGRMKKLSRFGLGTNPRKASAFTPEQEDMFWNTKILGDNNPKVLLRTLVYLNDKNFALRSGAEHRSLRFKNGQITLHEDDDVPYVSYVEDTSKDNQGGLQHMRVQRIPVLYMPFLIPPGVMYDCSSSTRDYALKLKPTVEMWFSRQAVGHNTLQKIVPHMCDEAGLNRHYTNHSLRATAATILYQAGIDEQLIMSQTGHRFVSGVRSYKRTSEKRLVSEVLNAAKKPRPAETATCDSDAERDENESPTYIFINCNLKVESFQ